MSALALKLSWWCFGLLVVFLPFTVWPGRRHDHDRARFDRERRNYGRNA